MRILVLSDSHGCRRAIINAIDEQPKAKHVFFLGDRNADLDGVSEIYPDRIFHEVCGNCDFGSVIPSCGFENLDGTGIFYTHGHRYGVKSTLYELKNAARTQGAKIVLFGHTHTATTEYDDGLYVVNPGSLSRGSLGFQSYAAIDIDGNNILMNIIKI